MEKERVERTDRRNRKSRKKVCAFCMDKIEHIDYKDVPRLRRYLSDRAKIIPRRVTGTCARHQRQLTVAVKRARHLAFLPYVGDYSTIPRPETVRFRAFFISSPKEESPHAAIPSPD